MFWTLLLVARTNSCEILTNSSLLCTNLSDFHLTSSNYSESLRSLNLEQCDQAPPSITSSAVEHIGIHCNGSLPAFAFENFVHLISIELLECELSEIPWQSLYVNGKTLSVDLRSCPLDCSCTNEWLISSQHYSTYAVTPILPETFQCSFSHCVRGTIMAEPYIECVPGDTITIDVNISAPTTELFAHRNYFSWHMSSAQNNVTEHLSKKHIQLVIYAVTEKQLGTISVVCWHCDHPLMTTIELRVRAPLRARLEDRGDSHLIVVSGWPINPINLTIEWSGETETRNLSDEKTVTFFNNLVVRPDTGQSLFYRRVFSVFALACSTCPVDHPAGNYSLYICSTYNCYRLHNYIQHVGNHTKLWTESFTEWPSLTPVALFFLLMPIFTMLLLRARVMRSCRAKMYENYFELLRKGLHSNTAASRSNDVVQSSKEKILSSLFRRHSLVLR